MTEEIVPKYKDSREWVLILIAAMKKGGETG